MAAAATVSLNVPRWVRIPRLQAVHGEYPGKYARHVNGTRPGVTRLTICVMDVVQVEVIVLYHSGVSAS